ncbi:hypothetical protein HPB47_022962 [Ixodes persulcatus]|uniref:Uncharacterized protein n=1 Tax=Ixodes persulcatus TaxID=34615 RepID=A0AC60QBG0_IXOPE|nr:hypothetical protein HPB47_022962 [Ixodes persulcatus]
MGMGLQPLLAFLVLAEGCSRALCLVLPLNGDWRVYNRNKSPTDVRNRVKNRFEHHLDAIILPGFSVVGLDSALASSQDYRIILHTLPSARYSFNSICLHKDLSARPYRVDDFGKALRGVVDMTKDVAGLGAFQFNHVWMLTLHNAAVKEKLVRMEELKVKGKKCLVIDPNRSEKSFKVHWIPIYVPDVGVKRTFEGYGRVKVVARERWRRPGYENIETTTRTVTMVLREGTTVDAIPHQVNILGNAVLVSIPGRPPMCLRCKRVGHMRKQCRAAWCNVCRTFGHEEGNCVQTYAAKTKTASFDEDLENLLDQDEMEETIGEPAAPAQGPQSSERPKSVLTEEPFEQINENQVIQGTPAGGRADKGAGESGKHGQPREAAAPKASVECRESEDEPDEAMEAESGQAHRESGTKKGAAKRPNHPSKANASEQRFQLVTSKRWKKTEGPQPPLRLTEVGASALEDFAFHDG